MSVVGENIKRIRKEKKLSQRQLADLSGISQSAISDIENPAVTKLPNIDTIQKLASALRVSIDELTGAVVASKKEAETDLLRKSILDDYDRMTPAQRAKAREYMDLLLNQKP